MKLLPYLFVLPAFAFAQDPPQDPAQQPPADGTSLPVATPAPAPTGGFTYSGSAELGFNSNISRRGDLAYRQFDSSVGGLRVFNARVIAKYLAPNGKYGVTLEPWIGDSVAILYRTETSDSEILKYTGQAFLTVGDGSRLSLDVGKFYAWIGYEAALGADGDHLSRSLLYTNGQPIYHYGGRLAYTVGPKLGVSLYAVQGWNQAERGTRGATYGAQVRYAADSATNFTFSIIDGFEGDNDPNRVGTFGGASLPNPGRSEVRIIDLIATRQLTSSTFVGLNVDLSESKGPNAGKWYGASLYARQTLSPVDQLAARLEVFRDLDGIRLGAESTITGATLTYDRKLTGRGLLGRTTARFEGRYDVADEDLFFGKNSQTSLSATLVVRF